MFQTLYLSLFCSVSFLSLFKPDSRKTGFFYTESNLDVILSLNRNPGLSARFFGIHSIDEFYVKRNSEGYIKTLEELISLIQEKCKKPAGEMHDQVFTTKSMSFEEFFKTSSNSDFTIFAGIGSDVRKFKVHKATLSPQSAVFEAMFKTDMKEKQTGKMKIKDFSAEVVEDLLRYAYAGYNPKEKNAMDLYALAAKYDFRRLKNLCEKIVLSNTDQDNAFAVLYIGYLYNSEVLKSKAFGEVKKKFPGIKLKESLHDNPDQVIKLIVAQNLMKRKLAEAEKEMTRELKEAENSDDEKAKRSEQQ